MQIFGNLKIVQMFGKIPFTQNQIIAVTWVINIVKKNKIKRANAIDFPNLEIT